MGKARTRWVRGVVALAVLGALSAAIMITPVGAANPVTKAKAKRISTKIFNKEFPGAFDTAFDAASNPLQQECRDGAILAHANIVGEAAFPAAYTTDPNRVQNAFNCKSPTNEVKVKRTGEGVYQVSLPGISNDAANTGKWVVVTGALGLCLFACSDTIVQWFPVPETGEGQVLIFIVGDAQPTADDANDFDAFDGQFSFAILDYS